MIGDYCIVRTYSAGVHYGIVKEINGTACILTDTCRVWRWAEGFTLHSLALDGPQPESRLSAVIPSILLTEAIEVIPCSEKSIQTFANYPKG
jgi:hypothetical protein